MKVALVHMRHAGTGGTERYLNQVAAHLAERGDEVRIVCRSHEAPPHPAVRFVTLRPFAVGASMRMQTFASAVEEHVQRERYDVVYGLGKTWTHDVVRLGGGCHATYVELAHGARARERGPLVRGALKNRLAIQIEARALAPGAYRLVVVNSTMVAKDVQARHAVPADRIRLVHNGVDLERFHPRLRSGPGAELRRSLGIAPEQTVVLFLGSGYARKGLDLALAAFGELARERRDVELLVCGFDSAAQRYERAARAAGIERRVRFLGGRGDAEVCFAAGDLYVLPTRYDPFANTTLEALACGLPVITTATNGASELLVEGRHGSVLPGGAEAQALARALREWTDRGRLDSSRAPARELAERHSARSKARESAAVLDEVLAPSRA
jgi:UDP-glucose:(heptosyl)LPS alpha-1,3-glucosyltransferase